MNSSTVSTGDDILASQYNDLREDVVNCAQDLPTTTGSANTQAITVDSQVTAYVAGQRFQIIAGYTNTGSATLNVNTIGAKTIYCNGTTLAPMTIKAGHAYELMYDGTNLVIIGGHSSIGPILLSRLEFSNSSTAQNTGTIAISSQYKYYEIKISGYRNTNSGTGSMRCTVNALVGTAYEHTNQSGNSTFGAPSTGGSYWELYSNVTSYRSLAYSWMVSNVKAGDSKVMFAMLTGYYHSSVAVNGAVNLGADADINTFTFTPMDGASADPITGVIEIFGYL